MTLSKYLLGAAIGVLLAKIYQYFTVSKQKKIQAVQDTSKAEEEILEIFFVRRPIEAKSSLTKELTFGPEVLKHSTELIGNLISSAQGTLRIAMYLFTSTPLAEKIIAACRRGVTVLLVVDHSMEHAKGSMIRRLHVEGVYVRVFKSEPAITMHHKLCLIDVPYDEKFQRLLKQTKSPATIFKAPIKLPKKNGVAITGSVNWTYSGLTCGHENFVVTSNEKICETAAAEFYKVWNESTPLLQ